MSFALSVKGETISIQIEHFHGLLSQKAVPPLHKLELRLFERLILTLLTFWCESLADLADFNRNI